ncbi:hypothetical protein GLAREA_04269 [Glarea lozoyensis ATCC 20868]|uniref:Uncharacterized protein n=1 Tax=Glarea lozoyensis (strain ATCC 20868 / MF5171) TaxID=1116229 RepID=S3DLR4_GLAL2|nr:uncharacterized protein GLAREA_04269 [Glarea lozoyensis ATCC 20868]EPE27478.1 hypothetical protein GLAREA_04269 [Glarea lozoyensis ATCC 20868]
MEKNTAPENTAPDNCASNDALKHIPTDRLVVTLIEELAKRVEVLERRRADTEKIDKEGLNAGRGTISDEVVINLPDIKPGGNDDIHSDSWACEKQLCRILPYGHRFVDGFESDIVEISLDYLSNGDAGLAARLEELGIAGIPDDNRRIFLEKFQEKVEEKEVLVRAYAVKLRENGGNFAVVDFEDGYRPVIYELGTLDMTQQKSKATPMNRNQQGNTFYVRGESKWIDDVLGSLILPCAAIDVSHVNAYSTHCPYTLPLHFQQFASIAAWHRLM